MFGPQLFGDLVDITFATARRWFEMLNEAPDFEPLHEPQCNIVTYRHLPQQLQGASDAGNRRFPDETAATGCRVGRILSRFYDARRRWRAEERRDQSADG